uniref:ADP-ribosylation factor-like protein 4A n=1 Tax=Ciona intestinalis TaxID=7719 RepID=F6T3I7_CIOIN
MFESTPNKLDDVKITDAEIKPRLAKIVVLGLEGCGKSTLLNVLAKRPEEGYSPTQGFNVVQIQSGECSLSVMEVGGGPSTRRYWSHFTSDMDLLIYVVDGSDKNNFNESKSELMKVLAESTNQVPCLLISNKQDLENAEKCSSIFNSKDLKEIGRKTSGNITILDATCCANGGEGVSFRETVISIMHNIITKFSSFI